MARPPKAESSLIKGPAGQLEALLESPADGEITGIAVVCHPHPLHGGTLDNKVAHTLARAFVARQMVALRFNFRGVGTSEGAFDEGRGERDDALAACHWLRQRFPGLPLWLSGFSFGAAVAIHAAADSDAAGLVSVAPAVTRVADAAFQQPDCAWLIVQGDQDELVDIDATISWVNDLRPGPELNVFPETSHFFHGKLTNLRATVEAFVDAHSAEPQKKPGQGANPRPGFA